MKRVLILVIVLSMSCMSAFAAEGMSDLKPFPNMMMDSVASQLNSATDLTIAEENRAILAALLTLEYCYYTNTNEIDYTQPIFVGKKDTTVSCAFATGDDYVVVFFQMNPTSTSYGKIYDCDSAMARVTMMMASDEVWPVAYDLYEEKLAAVIDQI
ncbi:MAG: hypothetical protein E7317_00285 [Clostridiales bacterium]|nr:hypothetical protein [Clostridiales bacterium]